MIRFRNRVVGLFHFLQLCQPGNLVFFDAFNPKLPAQCGLWVPDPRNPTQSFVAAACHGDDLADLLPLAQPGNTCPPRIYVIGASPFLRRAHCPHPITQPNWDGNMYTLFLVC